MRASVLRISDWNSTIRAMAVYGTMVARIDSRSCRCAQIDSTYRSRITPIPASTLAARVPFTTMIS